MKQRKMAKTRTIEDLRKELATKERLLEKLHARRDELTSQLKDVDKQIAALAGKRTRGQTQPKKPGKKAKRSAGKHSLGDVLANVLKDKGSVKVADAARMAIAAGYKTRSTQFGNIVSATLANDDRFSKVGRGLFKAK